MLGRILEVGSQEIEEEAKEGQNLEKAFRVRIDTQRWGGGDIEGSLGVSHSRNFPCQIDLFTIDFLNFPTYIVGWV